MGVVNWETFVVGGVTMVTSFCPCAAQRHGFRPIPPTPIPLTGMLPPLGNSHENAESKTKVSQLHHLLLWNLHFQQHEGWKVESQKPELVGHKLARAPARACATSEPMCGFKLPIPCRNNHGDFFIYIFYSLLNSDLKLFDCDITCQGFSQCFCKIQSRLKKKNKALR